jgi:adenylate cyclase
VKWLTSIWMVLVVMVLGLSLRVADNETLQQLRYMGFDAKITSLPQSISEDVVILNIGEGTLQKEGQYPFPRGHYARIISDLIEANAGVTGFTVMFPEPDRFQQDNILASWAAEPSAVVFAQKSSNKGRSGEARRENIVTSGNGDPLDWVDEYAGIVSNIPMLDQAPRGVGMVNVTPSSDGLVRKIPLVVQSGGLAYSSFPIEVIRSITSTKGYTIKVDNELGIDSLYIHPREFKTNRDGSIWVMWDKTFQEYEWGVDQLPDLNGKTVIIGLTAEGLSNPVPTANGPTYPHHLQASVVQTLLNQSYGTTLSQVTRPWWTDLAELALALVGGLLIVGAVYYLPLLAASFVVLASAVSAYFAADWLWISSMVLLDWTFVTILFIILALHTYGNNFYIQFKLREQIKGQFGTYLSPDMVDMLAKDPSLLKLGGERREMSFLFMDICGFTPISEFYKNKDDPEGLVELVNEFLDAMTNIILANGGTIDKYMGDCIMAFWNAPLDCANHAELAVKSALEIEEKTNELKDIYKARGLPDINVGTGVNTGACIVGNMGSATRFDYSVIGDAVNLAARLEATAARHEYIEYKTIISSFTRDQLPDHMICKKIGDIKVKGKEETIEIYSPQR